MSSCLVNVSAISVPPAQQLNYIAFYVPPPSPYQSVPAANLTMTALWTLQASQTSFSGNTSAAVTITLRSSNGTAQPSVNIVASCPASGGMNVAILSNPVLTDSSGRALFSLTSSNAIGFGQSPGNVTCSFSTQFSGAVTAANVTFYGLNACNLNYSPEPPQCGDPAP